MSSLVMMKGRRGLTDEKKREHASLVGVRFIKLVMEYCTSDVSWNGFQPVEVSLYTDSNGAVKRAVNWKKNSIGNDCSAGVLTFQPNEMNMGIAYLPDSEYNRRKLAGSVIGNNAMWKIDDERIEQEINELAESIMQTPEYKESVERLKQKREEVEERYRQKRERTKTEREKETGNNLSQLQEILKDLVQLQINSHQTAQVANIQNKVQNIIEKNSEPAPVEKKIKLSNGHVKYDYKNKRHMAIRLSVVDKVFKENDALVKELKGKYGTKFNRSPEYVSEIKPSIEKLLQERLDKEYANDISVSDED